LQSQFGDVALLVEQMKQLVDVVKQVKHLYEHEEHVEPSSKNF